MESKILSSPLDKGGLQGGFAAPMPPDSSLGEAGQWSGLLGVRNKPTLAASGSHLSRGGDFREVFRGAWRATFDEKV